jgi:predicted membrane metal-binding protein
MQRIKQFLKGKKTYLSAALIALVAICGWWFGVIGYAEALSLLGVAGAAAGLGAKSERTAEAILTVLGDIRSTQAKTAVGQKIDPKQFAADLSKQIMSQFAAGNLVRSTPAGAVSNVVVPGTEESTVQSGDSAK